MMQLRSKRLTALFAALTALFLGDLGIAWPSEGIEGIGSSPYVLIAFGLGGGIVWGVGKVIQTFKSDSSQIVPYTLCSEHSGIKKSLETLESIQQEMRQDIKNILQYCKPDR